MSRELIAYMLAHRHSALNKTLYGEEHGFGERTLELEMLSTQRHIEIRMPVLCRYANNSPIPESRLVEQSDWSALCSIVANEGGVRVTFSDGTSDFRAKLVMPDAELPRDGDVKVLFCWKESDDTIVTLRRGLTGL